MKRNKFGSETILTKWVSGISYQVPGGREPIGYLFPVACSPRAQADVYASGPIEKIENKENKQEERNLKERNEKRHNIERKRLGGKNLKH